MGLGLGLGLGFGFGLGLSAHLLHRGLDDRVGHAVEADEGLRHEQREEVVLHGLGVKGEG